MEMVRLNITLPEDLAIQLDELVGPRKKSRFIAEALRQRIKKIQEEKMQRLLEEGYRARREEGLSVAEAFQSADLEGWDEY